MKTLRVNAGGGYDILIERGLLKNCGEKIKKVVSAKKAAIEYDEILGRGNYFLEIQENGIPEQKIVNNQFFSYDSSYKQQDKY